MKRIAMLALGALLVGGAIAHADMDTDKKMESTHKDSKNPVTGTVTHTDESEAMAKDGDAKKKHSKKKVTKTKTDGSKSTETTDKMEDNK